MGFKPLPIHPRAEQRAANAIDALQRQASERYARMYEAQRSGSTEVAVRELEHSIAEIVMQRRARSSRTFYQIALDEMLSDGLLSAEEHAHLYRETR